MLRMQRGPIRGGAAAVTTTSGTIISSTTMRGIASNNNNNGESLVSRFANQPHIQQQQQGGGTKKTTTAAAAKTGWQGGGGTAASSTTAATQSSASSSAYSSSFMQKLNTMSHQAADRESARAQFQKKKKAQLAAERQSRLVFRDVGNELDKLILHKDLFLWWKYLKYGSEYAVDMELERRLRYYRDHALTEVNAITGLASSGTKSGKLMRGGNTLMPLPAAVSSNTTSFSSSSSSSHNSVNALLMDTLAKVTARYPPTAAVATAAAAGAAHSSTSSSGSSSVQDLSVDPVTRALYHNPRLPPYIRSGIEKRFGLNNSSSSSSEGTLSSASSSSFSVPFPSLQFPSVVVAPLSQFTYQQPQPPNNNNNNSTPVVTALEYAVKTCGGQSGFNPSAIRAGKATTATASATGDTSSNSSVVAAGVVFDDTNRAHLRVGDSLRSTRESSSGDGGGSGRGLFGVVGAGWAQCKKITARLLRRDPANLKRLKLLAVVSSLGHSAGGPFLGGRHRTRINAMADQTQSPTTLLSSMSNPVVSSSTASAPTAPTTTARATAAAVTVPVATSGPLVQAVLRGDFFRRPAVVIISEFGIKASTEAAEAWTAAALRTIEPNSSFVAAAAAPQNESFSASSSSAVTSSSPAYNNNNKGIRTIDVYNLRSFDGPDYAFVNRRSVGRFAEYVASGRYLAVMAEKAAAAATTAAAGASSATNTTNSTTTSAAATAATATAGAVVKKNPFAVAAAQNSSSSSSKLNNNNNHNAATYYNSPRSVADNTFIGRNLLGPFFDEPFSLRNYLATVALLVDHRGNIRWMSGGIPDAVELAVLPQLLQQLEMEYNNDKSSRGGANKNY